MILQCMKFDRDLEGPIYCRGPALGPQEVSMRIEHVFLKSMPVPHSRAGMQVP